MPRASLSMRVTISTSSWRMKSRALLRPDQLAACGAQSNLLDVEVLILIILFRWAIHKRENPRQSPAEGMSSDDWDRKLR